MNINNEGNLIPTVKIFSAYLLLLIVITLLPGSIPVEIIRENGPIETLSAYGYFLFCIFIFYFNMKGIVRTGFAPGFFVLLLGLRELDFHSRFTTMGMFKSRFFVSPDVPAMEKAIVTVFILGLIIYLVLFLKKRLPLFKRDLLAARPWAIAAACGFGCVFLSKALDGNTKVVALLFPMLDDPRTFSRSMEECLELFIPIFLIRSLILYSWDSVRGKVLK